MRAGPNDNALLERRQGGPPEGSRNIADASLQEEMGGCVLDHGLDDGYPFTRPVGKFKPNASGSRHDRKRLGMVRRLHDKITPKGRPDPQGPAKGTLTSRAAAAWTLSQILPFGLSRLARTQLSKRLRGFRCASRAGIEQIRLIRPRSGSS